jgi:LysM repeat protein
MNPVMTVKPGSVGDGATHIARSDSSVLSPQREGNMDVLNTRLLRSEARVVVRPKVSQRAVATPLASNAATRISATPSYSSLAAPMSSASTRVLPSLPRLAMTPDLRRQAAKPHAEAGIVVSPLQPLEMTSYTAPRNESLQAIAERFKMPLAVVAAANGLLPNVEIAQGTQLSIPRSLQVSYKGQPVTSDVAPILIGQTSVGAFRFLFEKQGGTMTWDAETQQVTAKNDKYEVTLTIGSDKATVNQKEEMMDMAAFLLSGRTMVPIRFFESALNAKVEWEPSTGRIYVASTQ